MPELNKLKMVKTCHDADMFSLVSLQVTRLSGRPR